MNDDVTSQAEEEAWTSMSLFAVLKKFESLSGKSGRLGETRRIDEDPVRIDQTPHLTFAASEVSGVDIESTNTPHIGQYVFGLLGPNGPLPMHLSELAVEQAGLEETAALSAFFNMFHHRMASLFFRAWADADPVTASRSKSKDPYSLYLRGLGGVANTAALERLQLTDDSISYWGPTIGASVRSAERLQYMISDYFGAKVVVRPFTGGWMEIPDSERLRLEGRSVANRLGSGATLGLSIWQTQSACEIVIGPLSWEHFNRLLPGTVGNQELNDWVSLYSRYEWRWKIRLILEKPADSVVRLGQHGRIGWDSWIGQRSGPAEDCAFVADIGR